MTDAWVRPGRTVETSITALSGNERKNKHDDVVTEEPLELRLASHGRTQTLAITMRTPGNDFELAAGFLYGESVVGHRDEIAQIGYCIDPAVDADQRYNIVNVELHGPLPNLERFERHFTIGSACGVCGRAQLASLAELGIEPIEDAAQLPVDVLYSLPDAMRSAQRVFSSTGGLHAAALFTLAGDPIAVREDVGRHNAVDKIAGWALLEGRLPLGGCVLMVSGRAGYEILQKSAVARIPIVCSVSAPSSLAVELAREFGITLAGFVRGQRANIYSAPERIVNA